ncbi:hypothetical protein [Paracidobacterium acidisoli]|uniref:hypothetical protein n=1 Tax=Paracidobacterium acidisoli TaxID=2303751 RepID=UPI0018F1AB6A|nr:hypothetical protein [Paracidobacterium acidisoli]MBT9329515.1 hypothetical protein [Paracidobacterium acidisoli]
MNDAAKTAVLQIARIEARSEAMADRKKYKSDAFEAIHTNVAAMYRIGTIDEATMRSFDESCLVDPSSQERANASESQPLRGSLK